MRVQIGETEVVCWRSLLNQPQKGTLQKHSQTHDIPQPKKKKERPLHQIYERMKIRRADQRHFFLMQMGKYLGMGPNPVPPVNIPIPTKID